MRSGLLIATMLSSRSGLTLLSSRSLSIDESTS